MKNRILLENYFLPGDLEAQIEGSRHNATLAIADENAQKRRCFPAVSKGSGVEIALMSAEDFEAWCRRAKMTSHTQLFADVPDGSALLDLIRAVQRLQSET